MQLGSHGIDLLRHLFGDVQTVLIATATTMKARVLADDQIVAPDTADLALALYTLASGLRGVHEIS